MLARLFVGDSKRKTPSRSDEAYGGREGVARPRNRGNHHHRNWQAACPNLPIREKANYFWVMIPPFGSAASM